MRVIIFGASGMVGHGALQAALAAEDVTEVVAVLRSPIDEHHPKLRQVVHGDFTNYSELSEEFADLDACFFCLGTSSFRMSEAEYSVIAHDYPLAAAEALLELNPYLTFVLVTGAGSDRTESGRTMWARVRGRAENELIAMSSRSRMFRPGYIHPMDGGVSKTPLYALMYRGLSWSYPLLRRVAPQHVTTSRAVGRAMVAVSRPDVAAPQVLETPDINHWGA